MKLERQQQVGQLGRSTAAGAVAKKPPLAPELMDELRGIFSNGGPLGFSGGVDNFLHAEIGNVYENGQYVVSREPVREKAARVVAVLSEMKREFPDAFQEKPFSGDLRMRAYEGERLYLQAMLEQADALAKTGAFIQRAAEPSEAKRARVVLPQLLEVDDPPTRSV